MKSVEIEFLMRDRGVREGIRGVEHEVLSLDGLLQRVGGTLAGVFAVDKARDFIREVVNVRGEVEALEISFETLAGKTKGRELFGEIREFAVSTPMQMQDLAKGAQTLLGFNVEAEKVMPILRQIGDISMGDAQKFQSLTLAFSQMSSTGRLMGQDLLQMINAGFNPLTVIAEKTGKSMSDLKDEMAAGKVSVKMVEEAFASAAGEGGKFHGMLEKQSKGLKGALSNLEGAWQDALNSVGEESEGALVSLVDLTTEAVKNFDRLGSAILTVVAAYGEWKGTLMVIEAYHSMIAKQQAGIEAARVSGLQQAVDNARGGDTGATERDTAATAANTQAKEANARAVEAEVAAMEKELAAKVQSAAEGLRLAEAEEAQAGIALRVAEVQGEQAVKNYEAAVLSGDGAAIERAEEELSTAALNVHAASEAKDAASRNVSAASAKKEAAAVQLSTFQTEVDTVQKKANTAATGLWAAATRMATTAWEGLKAAVASNPLGMALMAVTSIVGLLSVFKSKTEESTEALDKLKEASQEQMRELSALRAILSTVDKGTQQWKGTLEKVNAMAQEYHTTLLTEEDTVAEMGRKYDELGEAIRAAAAQKLMAEAASSTQEELLTKEKKALDALIETVSKGYSTFAAGGWGYLENFKNVTTTTWAAISQEVLSKSEEIRHAAEQGPLAMTRALTAETAQVEKMLLATGEVTEEEVAHYHREIAEYVATVGAAAISAGEELERTEGQLRGIAGVANETKDAANRSIEEMNYEQLQEELVGVQKELEEAGVKAEDLNGKQIRIKTDDTEVNGLISKLLRIKSLLGEKLTAGSEADLQERMKNAKERRTKAAPGSKEWKEANAEVGKLNTALGKLTSGHAESSSKKSGSGSGSGRSKTGSADTSARDAARYKELQERQKKEATRAATDLAFDTRQAEIDAMKDGTEKVLKQIELDFEREKEAIRREYEDLKETKKENLKKLWEADPANKKKAFSVSDDDPRLAYTAEEEAYRKARETAAETDYARKVAEESRKERESMNDYLKAYGTYQQQKLAIAEEYAAKIAKAQTEGERQQLEAERDASERKLDVDALMTEIDWASVWGDFGSALRGETEQLIARLDEYVKSEAFKQLGADDQRQIVSALNELRLQSGTDWKDVDFRKIGELTKTYQTSVQELVQAKEAERKASDELRKAIAKREEAERSGDAAATARAKEEEAAAREAAENAAAETKKREQQAASDAAALDTAGKKAVGVINSTASALQGLASGSLQGAFDGLKTLAQNKQVQKALGNGIGELFGGATGEIVSAALGLLDLLKDGIGGLLAQLTDLLWGAVNGIVGDVFSGDILLKPLKSVKDGIGTLLDTVSFGGFSSVFGTHGNAKEVNRIVDRLTASNEALQAAIDHLRERLEDTGGDKASEIYDQAYAAMQEQSENNRRMLEAKMGYHGSHHSNDYYLNKAFNAGDYQRMMQKIYENTGHRVSIRSAGDLWKLSSEDLAQLQELEDVWQKLLTTGKYDMSDWLENYVDDYKELQELQDAWRESITATTFDNVRSSMDALLKDYTKGTSDALATVDDMFKDAITRSLSSGEYYDKLEGWYKRFAEAMRGGLTAAEAAELRREYEQWYKEMSAKRDEAYKSAGIDPESDGVSQSGKAGTFTTMTQDQGTKLEGLFTSGQIHWASMDELLGRIADHWSVAADRLRDIEENTRYCRELSTIADCLRELKRDGMKVR